MSEIFSELYCGLTNDHVLKEPINLSCGHSICKQCVPNSCQVKIKCKICRIETEKSILKINTESSASIKRKIKSSLSSLFEELEKRATNEINSFKSLPENRESTLEAHFIYLEEEIGIRIESIKNNLDELFETFKKDLVEIKKEIIKVQNDALNRRTDTNELENYLKGLRDYAKNNQDKTEEKFYEHQENFKSIKKMIENFQYAFYSCNLDFKQPKDKVDKKLIGEIVCTGLNAYNMNKIKRVLMNRKIETIQLEAYGVSLIGLPNGYFVYGTAYGQVFLLNEKFQVNNRVETGGWSFCCTLNHRNEIYMSDDRNNRIILFDLNLNKLAESNNRLNDPSGLCCHGDYLYICNRGNNRIQILTLDFDYVSTIEIDGCPRRVQISNTTICVICERVILFYDLVSKALKCKHNTAQTLNINYFDSIFCALNVLEKKFYFFDSDGHFLEEKGFHEKLILTISDFSGSICLYKDILYMTDWSGKVFRFLE